jgi:hypothetical protein
MDRLTIARGDARPAQPKRQAKARQAGRRLIARGERPTYHLGSVHDGRWTVETCEWMPEILGTRAAALSAATTAIASWLGVDPAAIDVEVVDADTTAMTPPVVDSQVYGG